jgi:hypothetical protein
MASASPDPSAGVTWSPDTAASHDSLPQQNPSVTIHGEVIGQHRVTSRRRRRGQHHVPVCYFTPPTCTR